VLDSTRLARDTVIMRNSHLIKMWRRLMNFLSGLFRMWAVWPTIIRNKVMLDRMIVTGGKDWWLIVFVVEEREDRGWFWVDINWRYWNILKNRISMCCWWMGFGWTWGCSWVWLLPLLYNIQSTPISIYFKMFKCNKTTKYHHFRLFY